MTTLRQATPDDLPGIISVQLESWRRTYIGVLPDAYLGEPVKRDLETTWVPTRLSEALVIVAERDGQILGVAASLPETADGPYLDNLHVAAAAEGSGVGRGLMGKTAEVLMETGHDSLHLTVVATNARAVAFYRRMRGAFGAPITDEMYGHPVQALPVRWSDLAALARHAA